MEVAALARTYNRAQVAEEKGMNYCKAPKSQTTRRILTIVSVTSIIAAFAGALPQPARAEPINCKVILVDAKAGECLTIAGGESTANNVTALQFVCDTDPSRRWILRLKL